MVEDDQASTRSNPTPSRPAMAEDYGVAREFDQTAFPWSGATDLLASARNYWIGTTCPDGRPHAMPLWGLWRDDMLYFATGRNSRKARNLAANPHVVAHLESGDQVVILEGVVVEVTDPEVLAWFADAYEAKYQFRPSITDPKQVIYGMRPEVAFTWGEKDFPQSALRWNFRA